MSDREGLRLVRQPLGWDLAPADVLRLVRGDAHPVALCGAWADGCDVIASEPVTVRSAAGPLGDVFDAPWPVGSGDLGSAGTDFSAGTDSSAGTGFGGGWIGYLGYSAGAEALPATGPRALPAWWFGFYDHVLRRDRKTGEWCFEALWTPERAAALESRFAELTRRPTTGQAGDPPSYEFGPFRLVPGADGHQEAVRKAVEYIRQGDIFQANVTLRAEAEFAGDPLDVFCQGVTALDPPYAAFIGVSALTPYVAGPSVTGPSVAGPGGRQTPGPARAAVASLSPELFLRRTGERVISKPIKGTAPRAADDEEAAAQRAELEASAKNRAENVMIVDLVRNDLSRVCLPGSVTVPVLLGPEPHPGIWHLVSTVTGTLNPGAGDGDLIRAAFPPGSVTGAPKVRALEIIDELEARPREAYTGAIGYRSPFAGLELNVAIRTFEFAPWATAGRAWLGAGGGIVADSDPAAEYAECLLKATPLLTAIGARLDASAPPAEARQAAETGAAGLAALLPRPAAGVFTSLLVTDGQTRGLAAHLARLESSVRDLYGKDLPASLPADLAGCLAARPSGRLRITVRPLGGPLQATVEVVPLPPPTATAITLRPVTVPGGIGPHKYRDRRLLANLASHPKTALTKTAPTKTAPTNAGPNEQLLLTDETGELLETDRANVFAVIDGVLLTPPADGRLLPGTARAAVMRAAHAHGLRVGQKPLTLDELAEATEVFVTNAVAGVLPVTAIKSTAVEHSHQAWPPGPITATLSAALQTRPPDPPPTPPLPPPPTPSPPPTPPPPAPPPATATRPCRLRNRPRSSVVDCAIDTLTPPADPARPLVILIDNYDSFTWNLAHLLDTAGARVEVVRNDEVTAAQVTGARPAGVVISPGPCAPAEAGISIDAVTACATAGIPLLGICLGHQAIGAAFGADIIRAPSPVHGKAFPVSHDGHGVLAGLPNPFKATRYHSLIVDESTLPSDLLVTARTDGIPMAIRHATGPIEGVQFHPESILTTHGSAIITNFVSAAARTRPAKH